MVNGEVSPLARWFADIPPRPPTTALPDTTLPGPSVDLLLVVAGMVVIAALVIGLRVLSRRKTR